jgi:DNA-binding transcriptional ArsR family regulator
MERRRAEKVSKALADATRLSILEAISARKEMTCGDIANLRGIEI